MERDTTVVLYKLATKLSLPFTKADIIHELQLHPHYNSLLGISDVLNSWKVPNLSVRIRTEQLRELPPFFITLLMTGEFAFVTQKPNDTFLVETKSENSLLSFTDLTQLFTGAVLVAEADPDRFNKPHFAQRCFSYLSSHRTALLGVFMLIALSFFLFYSYWGADIGLRHTTLLITKTLGLIVSILLLAQAVNGNNALVHRLCSAFDKNGCNTILTSEASKVFEGLSWSEVGVFYFGGTWVVLLFNMTGTGIGLVISLTNLLALPYTIYSIYYQSRIAKSWCILCCTVQVLLWLEFFTLTPELFGIWKLPDTTKLFLYLIEMMVPALIWLSVRDVFYGHQHSKILAERLRKFRSNKSLFNMQLAQSPPHQLMSADDTLNFGNVNAETTLTMVTNPYCEPCMRSHQIIHRWLETRTDLNLQLVFALDGSDDHRSKVTTHLLEIKEHTSQEAAMNAFSAWSSGQKNFNKWRERHPAQNKTGQEHKLIKHRDWCQTASIKHTPTFFINGHLLPDIYQIEDVKYLL